LLPFSEENFPMMNSIRKEVRDFMHAAETLLGPVINRAELSQDERDLIGLYIQQVTERFSERPDAGDAPSERGHQIAYE
jgi:hypothetical protein